MKIPKLFLLTALVASTAACEPGYYGDWGRPSSGYSDGYNSGYYGGSDRYRDDRYRDDRYRNDRDYYRGDRDYRHDRDDDDRHHDRHNDRHDDDRDRRPSKPAPTPTPPPAPPVIRPSCPSNTTFDGKHCIVPENQRRKGGKGTVNACPKGMWVSGDQCVGG